MKNPYINQNLYKLKAKLEEFSLEHNNSYEIKRELGEYLSAPKLLKNGENVPFVLNNEQKIQISFPKSKTIHPLCSYSLTAPFIHWYNL